MKRMTRGPEQLGSRLSLSGPGKFDHEIFARAQAGDLSGVLRFFERPPPPPTSAAGGVDGDDGPVLDSDSPDVTMIAATADAGGGSSSSPSATDSDDNKPSSSTGRSPSSFLTDLNASLLSSIGSMSGASTPTANKKHRVLIRSSQKNDTFDASNSEGIDRLLHCAAKFDWPDLIARHLVQAPGFRTSKVKSAFRRACAHGSIGVVRLLLDGDVELGVPRFCSLHDAGTDGKNGLHIACHHGRPNVVEELLARAARADEQGHQALRVENIIESEDLSRTTPLLLAVAAGHVDCVLPMLIAGAKIVTNSGKSAVDVAALHNMPELAETLKSFLETGRPPSTLAQLACDLQWEKLLSWARFAVADRFHDTHGDETALYWAVFRQHAEAAVQLGIHHGETTRRANKGPWEAQTVDFIVSETFGALRDWATTANLDDVEDKNFDLSSIITKIFEVLFMPLVEAESNLGMVEPEQQREHWKTILNLLVNESMSMDILGTSSQGENWQTICTLLGSITIGLPQMCYGFLRVLPTILPDLRADERFKKDFITLVINCVSFDRQRSEARRFADVLTMIDKLISRGDSELSRQIYQFLLQSAFVLRLGWYPECLPLISKLADHVTFLWGLEVIADETAKASQLNFLLEFEGARNEKDKHLFDLLAEAEDSCEAVSSLMRLGCRPSRRPDCCPDRNVAALFVKARFFEESAENFGTSIEPPSVAELVRRGEVDVVLNLLRRPQTALTARDLGFARFLGRTAYEWCSTLYPESGMVKEMQEFLVPVLRRALEENDVGTLSTLLQELNSVAFTLAIEGDQNVIQLVLAPAYKFPPVRDLVLRTLESTRPDLFQQLLESTTLKDVAILEDPLIARKFLENSAHFAFDSCRVHLPLDSSAVNKPSRQSFFPAERGQVNVAFEGEEEGAGIDNGREPLPDHMSTYKRGFMMMSDLVGSLKRKHKFTRRHILAHPCISAWCQINWKLFKSRHTRLLRLRLACLILTCVHIFCFASWNSSKSPSADKVTGRHFWILVGMWIAVVLATVPQAAWEVERYSILGPTLYFYHAETYLYLATLAIPILMGFPVSFLTHRIVPIQIGTLVFVPALGSLAVLSMCGNKAPGKAVMMFVRTLDQARKLYFYAIPAIGFLVSFLIVSGSSADTFGNALGNAVSDGILHPLGANYFWGQENENSGSNATLQLHSLLHENLAAPLLEIAAIFVLKLLIVSIFVGSAVRVAKKVDQEAEFLWNERKLTFMYQVNREPTNLCFKLTKKILVGNPVPGARLCSNHFVLATHGAASVKSDEVTTVHEFKKFVNRLKAEDGKDGRRDAKTSEVLNLLRKLEQNQPAIREDAGSAASSGLESAFAALEARIASEMEQLRAELRSLHREISSRNPATPNAARLNLTASDTRVRRGGSTSISD